MGRFSSLSEQTFRLQFKKGFDFLDLFISMLSGKKKKEMLLVFDLSFISKSGKHTYGLARYWNGKAQRAEKGLEIGCWGAIDVVDGTAYHLQAKQTNPDKTKSRMCQYVSIKKMPSMHNIKQYFYNRYLTKIIFANLDSDLRGRKINRLYHPCLDIGRIAA